MEFTGHWLWNIILTLVVAPILYSIRTNTSELKRLDILLNKTREEVAKEYVTKQELKDDMSTLMERIQKIDEKLETDDNDIKKILNLNDSSDEEVFSKLRDLKDVF